jgi:hypothetical protein
MKIRENKNLTALTNLQVINSHQRIDQEKPLAKLADVNLFIRNRLLKYFSLLFGNRYIIVVHINHLLLVSPHSIVTIYSQICERKANNILFYPIAKAAQTT